MECPRNSSSSQSLISCKFCHKKIFDSQTSLCEHEVEEHGYVRPCTVTTPKVIPSGSTSSKDPNANPPNLSDINSSAALWAKWTQENEKLFREFVLNIRSVQSIHIPETYSSSYYLDFVPDYSSADFPACLSQLAGNPVVIHANGGPVVESAMIPLPIELEAVPLIQAETLEAVVLPTAASTAGNNLNDPILNTQEPILTYDVDTLNSLSSSASEELILIPASVTETGGDEGSNVFQAMNISENAQECILSGDVVDETCTVAVQLPSIQQVTLDEVTGQLIVPTNIILDANGVIATTVAITTSNTVLQEPFLDEVTGELIMSSGSAEHLEAVIMSPDSETIASQRNTSRGDLFPASGAAPMEMTGALDAGVCTAGSEDKNMEATMEDLVEDRLDVLSVEFDDLQESTSTFTHITENTANELLVDNPKSSEGPTTSGDVSCAEKMRIRQETSRNEDCDTQHVSPISDEQCGAENMIGEKDSYGSPASQTESVLDDSVKETKENKSESIELCCSGQNSAVFPVESVIEKRPSARECHTSMREIHASQDVGRETGRRSARTKSFQQARPARIGLRIRTQRTKNNLPSTKHEVHNKARMSKSKTVSPGEITMGEKLRINAQNETPKSSRSAKPGTRKSSKTEPSWKVLNTSRLRSGVIKTRSRSRSKTYI